MVAALGSAEVPDRIDIVMLGKCLDQMITWTCNNVDHTAGQIGGLKNLVKIGSTERVKLGGNDHDGVATCNRRSQQGDKGQQRVIIGAGNANRADVFVDPKNHAT